MIAQAREWCRGKNGWVRLPFLIFFAYLLVRYWRDPVYYCILSPLNLGIHELGHLALSFLGNFFGIIGGTLFQLIAPVAAMINFYRQDDFFSIALSFGWLSTSLFDIARYVGDARAMNLPLVSPFSVDNTIHDWNYILAQLGLLRYDAILAYFLKCLATLSMFVCLAVGLWLLWQMFKNRAVE